MKKIITFITLLLPFITIAQQIEKTWYSVLNVQGTDLPLEITVKKEGKSYHTYLVSPLQSKQSIKMDKSSYKKKTLLFESTALRLLFTGTYQTDSITGVLQQNGNIFPLTFYTTNKYIVKKNRPQTPKEPFNYQSKVIKFKNNKEQFTLEGTLTLPNAKPQAIVVLVSGSGSQDRDNTIEEHRSFLVMADYFAQNNIATFRYDDRGFGNSEGLTENATTVDLAEDAKSAIEMLKSNNDYKDIPIGIIGHSEGGMIAYILAAENPDLLKFIVMIAAPTTTGKDLLLLQQKQIAAIYNTDPLIIEQNYLMNESIYNAIIDNENKPDLIKNAIALAAKKNYASLPEDIKVKIPNEETYTAQLQAINTIPWLQYFIKFKPSDYLSKINIPALVFFGSNDLQVDADRNMEAINLMFADKPNAQITVHKMDGLNHLMQFSETGSPNEYGALEETINMQVVQMIQDFINQYVDKNK